MNTTTWAGVVLITLGLASVIATGAATAIIPAVFGLLLLGLGILANKPARATAATWAAAGVALLGLIAPLANLARVIGATGFTLNAATFANAMMAATCGLYLALLAWERLGGRNGAPTS